MTGNYESIETVLLAAGLSVRMGETNKLLLELEGETLIRRAASLYCGLGMRVTVVLGHQADVVDEAVKGLRLKTVFNPDYASGQQSSIHTGLTACNFSGAGVLIALADQPFLTKADIAAYCDDFLKGTREQIMVPWFNQKRGNPVIFPSHLAKHAFENADANYRRFIDKNPSQVRRYAAPNVHFTTDIDTPKDVRKL